MNNVLLKWIVPCAVAMLSLPVCAQMVHRHDRDARRGGDERAEGQQRPQPASPDAQRADSPANGRMSPEERRQLRRDINEAGRDIYQRHPPRPAQP